MFSLLFTLANWCGKRRNADEFETDAITPVWPNYNAYSHTKLHLGINISPASILQIHQIDSNYTNWCTKERNWTSLYLIFFISRDCKLYDIYIPILCIASCI